MFQKLFSKRGLSFERLRSFLEVASAGGISKAAQSDPVRQSQYSRQISELESFFGIDLVSRQGRGLQLTEAGRVLATLAREQFMGFDDFQTRWEEAPKTFRIGAGDSLIHWIILPRVSKLQKLFPKTQIHLFNLRSSDITERLNDLRLDFGIARTSILKPPLKQSPLGDVRYALFIPRKILPSGNPSEQKLMSSLPWVTLGTDSEFMEQVTGAAKENNIPLEFKLITESFPQAARAVHSGSYAAILPLHAGSDFDSKEVKIIETPFLKKTGRKVSLGWNPRLMRINSTAESILKSLKELLVIGD